MSSKTGVKREQTKTFVNRDAANANTGWVDVLTQSRVNQQDSAYFSVEMEHPPE